MPKPIKLERPVLTELKVVDSEIEHHKAQLELDKEDPEDEEAKELIAQNTTKSSTSSSSAKPSSPTRTGRNTAKSLSKKS